MRALVLAIAVLPHVAHADGKPTKGGSDDEFAEITQGRPVVNECNASFKVEVDGVAFHLGYMDFAADLPSFTWEQAMHDIIEGCRFAVRRLAPLCQAQGRGYHGDPDENPANIAVKKGVKKIVCTLTDAKKKTNAPQSSFADGTWTVAFGWWTTRNDFIGAEAAVATGLKLVVPDREAASNDIPSRAICHAQKDCKSGFTCGASAAHGPRCLSQADLAPPAETPDEDTGGGGGTSRPSTPSKPKKQKKPEGAVCKYTSECEDRPGIRCTAPRGSKSGTKMTCTDVTHGY